MIDAIVVTDVIDVIVIDVIDVIDLIDLIDLACKLENSFLRSFQ